MLTKQWTYFPAANPTKVTLFTQFTNALFWTTAASVNVGLSLSCCVARRVATDSLSVSVKAIIQKRHIFQCCSGCSLCLDLLIFVLFLNLFAFSALVSAFKFFTRTHCLQFSGLSMCSVTLAQNRFLKKIADRFTCISFVKTSYSNIGTFKFESSPSEESRTSDVASPNFVEVTNILTLSEEQYLAWCNTTKHKMKRHARNLEGGHAGA